MDGVPHINIALAKSYAGRSFPEDLPHINVALAKFYNLMLPVRGTSGPPHTNLIVQFCRFT